MNKNALNGLNLKIDESIHKLCEMANKSSSSTRSTLYIVIVTCVLALISAINTHPGNWAVHRTQHKLNKIDYYRKKIDTINAKNNAIRDTLFSANWTKYKVECNIKKNYPGQIYADSINRLKALDKDTLFYLDSLMMQKVELERLIGIKVERFLTVQVPFLGNYFDVNNLSIVVGITLGILLIILKFTLKREHCNLIIALNSVTDRYTDLSDKTTLKELIEESGESEANYSEHRLREILSDLNTTRRKYHYNYLTMNDVFTIPTIRVNGTSFSPSNNDNRVVSALYWLPFFIFCLIVFNDWLTGWTYDGNLIHSRITVIIGIMIVIPILFLSNKCFKIHQKIEEEYKLFKHKNYKFDVVV